MAQYQPQSGRLAVFCLWLYWLEAGLIHASNWAQVTGPQMQDYVFSRRPNHDYYDSTKDGYYPGKNDHWSARKGHAVVAVPRDDVRKTLPRVYVLGGDSFVRDSGYLEHGGSYLNDVWYSEGAKWTTVWSYDDVVSLRNQGA